MTDDIITQALDAAASYIDRLRLENIGRPVNDLKETGEAYERLERRARAAILRQGKAKSNRGSGQ